MKIPIIDDQVFEEARALFRAKDLENLKNCFKALLTSFKETGFLYDKTYYHPLGFIYAELIEFSNRDTIRINVWSENRYYQEPLMEIHNHFYKLNSLVIEGKMVNNIYQIKEDKQPNHAVYMGSYNPVGGRTLQRTGQVLNAELFQVQEINKGEFYSIETDKIHTSYVPADQFTCTFVYASERGNPNPLILGPVDGLEAYSYSNKLVDKIVVDRIIRCLDGGM